MSVDFLAEHPLEQAATAILAASGYVVANEAFGELPMTVAEDPNSVIGLVGGNRWVDVAPRLDSLPLSFANWAAHRGAAAKQWDLYVLVLLQSQLAPEEVSDVERWVEDLSYARRIVRAGLTPRPASLRPALAAFLPLEMPAEAIQLKPLDELADRIRLKGVDAQAASSAITAFRTTGEVSVG